MGHGDKDENYKHQLHLITVANCCSVLIGVRRDMLEQVWEGASPDGPIRSCLSDPTASFDHWLAGWLAG